VHAAIALEIRGAGRPIHTPACVISGGETTVHVQGSGLGGRNQEFALAAALEIQGQKGMAIFSAGTDGTDGPRTPPGRSLLAIRCRGQSPKVSERLNVSAEMIPITFFKPSMI